MVAALDPGVRISGAGLAVLGASMCAQLLSSLCLPSRDGLFAVLLDAAASASLLGLTLGLALPIAAREGIRTMAPMDGGRGSTSSAASKRVGPAPEDNHAHMEAQASLLGACLLLGAFIFWIVDYLIGRVLAYSHHARETRGVYAPLHKAPQDGANTADDSATLQAEDFDLSSSSHPFYRSLSRFRPRKFRLSKRQSLLPSLHTEGHLASHPEEAEQVELVEWDAGVEAAAAAEAEAEAEAEADVEEDEHEKEKEQQEPLHRLHPPSSRVPFNPDRSHLSNRPHQNLRPKKAPTRSRLSSHGQLQSRTCTDRPSRTKFYCPLWLWIPRGISGWLHAERSSSSSGLQAGCGAGWIYRILVPLDLNSNSTFTLGISVLSYLIVCAWGFAAPSSSSSDIPPPSNPLLPSTSRTITSAAPDHSTDEVPDMLSDETGVPVTRDINLCNALSIVVTMGVLLNTRVSYVGSRSLRHHLGFTLSQVTVFISSAVISWATVFGSNPAPSLEPHTSTSTLSSTSQSIPPSTPSDMAPVLPNNYGLSRFLPTLVAGMMLYTSVRTLHDSNHLFWRYMQLRVPGRPRTHSHSHCTRPHSITFPDSNSQLFSHNQPHVDLYKPVHGHESELDPPIPLEPNEPESLTPKSQFPPGTVYAPALRDVKPQLPHSPLRRTSRRRHSLSPSLLSNLATDPAGLASVMTASSKMGSGPTPNLVGGSTADAESERGSILSIAETRHTHVRAQSVPPQNGRPPSLSSHSALPSTLSTTSPVSRKSNRLPARKGRAWSPVFSQRMRWVRLAAMALGAWMPVGVAWLVRWAGGSGSDL